jgi:hypothetical protein
VNIDRIKNVLAIAAVVGLAAAVGCRRAEPEPVQTQQPEPAQEASPVGAGEFDIALDTGGSLKMTAAPLAVTVRENGKPVTDVEVTVELRMAPDGAMGEMRTGAELKPVGDGHYRGQVDMTMAGKWDAIVRVRRGGQIVATHTEPVTAE